MKWSVLYFRYDVPTCSRPPVPTDSMIANLWIIGLLFNLLGHTCLTKLSIVLTFPAYTGLSAWCLQHCEHLWCSTGSIYGLGFFRPYYNRGWESEQSFAAKPKLNSDVHSKWNIFKNYLLNIYLFACIRS